MSNPSPADIYQPQGVQFSLRDLLVDADRTARRMLTQPSTSNGTSLLAGWDTVLAAAGDVITSVQTPTALAAPPTDARATPNGQPAAATAGRLIDQLTSETRALEVAQVPSLLHPDLEQLVHTWQQAVGVRAQEQLSWEPSEKPHQAVGRVLGTLATVAHATQAALAGGGPGVDALGREQAEGFHRLLQRHEQLTLRTVRALAVGPANPAARSGQDPATGAAPPAASTVAVSSGPALDRLSAQLDSWGRLATAAAANPDTPDRDLRRIANTEAMTTAAARFLVAAAARQHELPAHAVPHLQRRLKRPPSTGKSPPPVEWLRRRGITAAATMSVDRASQDLARAVRAALQALPPGAAGPASSSVSTPARTQASLVPVARQITENSAILAEVFARLPARAQRPDSTGRLQLSPR